MSIVVTGATGHLGHLVVRSLLARGVAPDDIVAGGRNPEALAELAALGVRAVALDYDDPATIDAALDGANRVLLISGLAENRVEQHTAVIDAAKRAGAELIAYTSGPNAQDSSLLLFADHAATERVIQASGLPYTILRNGWYHENYTAQLPGYLEHGAVLGAAGEGRISGAPRSDYAEAAAVVLTTDGHANTVYELGGDTAYTLAELAAAITEVTGTEVTYRDLPEAELRTVLESAGLPAPFAAILADADRAVRDEAALEVTTGHLAKLIGHPTGALTDAIRAAAAS